MSDTTVRGFIDFDGDAGEEFKDLVIETLEQSEFIEVEQVASRYAIYEVDE